MKKWIIFTSLSLALVPLQAQEHQAWVAVQGGYDWQANPSRNAEGSPVVGLAAGTWCTPRWGGEVSLLGTRLASQSTGADCQETHGAISALFNLDPGSSAWTPYVRAGVGGTQLSTPFSASGTTTRLSFHGGLGIQSFSTEHVLFGVEARAIRVQTQTAYTEVLGLVTLGFRWGAPARIVPAALPVAVAPAPAPVPVPTPRPVPVPLPAPAPAPVPPPVVAKPLPPRVLARIVLNEAVLHFANGKHVVPAQGVKAIQKVAQSLKAFPGKYTLVVTGYTSSVGRPAYNRALSKLRADAVAKVLEQSGIPALAVQTAGAGPDRPVASNRSRVGQARNRRVEIEVKAPGQAVQTQTVDTDPTEV